MPLRSAIAAIAGGAMLLSGCANIGVVNGVEIAQSGTGVPVEERTFCERNLILCIAGGVAVAGAIGYAIHKINDDNDAPAVMNPAPPMISDRTAKRDIARLFELPNGLGIFSFRYIDPAHGQGTYVGLMAQEVADMAPAAIRTGADGIMRLDYAALGLRMATLEDWEAMGPKALLALP
ncbi:MAG: tail fiber domain-containing protein [Pseudomonadota bacterium]